MQNKQEENGNQANFIDQLKWNHFQFGRLTIARSSRIWMYRKIPNIDVYLYCLQTESDVPLHVHVASDTFSFRKKIKEKLASNSTVFFRNGKDSVHNDAFEEIGDDDL